MPRMHLVALLALPACIGGGDDSAPSGETQWYMSCGDPVCQGYTGPFADTPLCAELGVSVGELCEDTTASCDPEDGCNALLVCAGSDPTQQDGGCPISLKAFKKDIELLDAPARAALADQAREIRLTRWRYLDALPASRPSVGFLIDDMPAGSPAVRPDGGHVDLYGYTSLVLALSQQQAQELEVTRAELEATKAQLEALEARLQALEAAKR